MPKKNRNSLKNDFQEGALPTAEAFSDLIDSALNVVDDGFEKTDQDGFKVAQLGKTGKLLSFYENVAVQQATWSIRLDQGGQRLVFASSSQQPALSLSSTTEGETERTRVGINQLNPRHDLDVAGVVAAGGRIGRPCPPVKADGVWHDITEVLDGCQALEVMAGVGDKETGRYALVHAIAVNAFNSRGHITCHQSHYGSRCDQIDLRWQGDMHAYTLQVRSRCAYPAHAMIQCYITALWFDPFMQGSDSRKKPTSV